MVRAKAGLGDVLFGKARGAILALLYGHPDQSFYYRQITRRMSDLSVGAIQRELDTLTNLGLVTRSSTGKQVFYQANTAHPVFGELRALVVKTVGVFQQLRSALAPIADRISVAFVYGSVARQEEKAESDVDLLIVGTVTMEELLEELAAVETSLGRTINSTIYSARDFKAKLAVGNHFLTSVIRTTKAFVIGDEDELRRVGGRQAAPTRSQ